MSLKKNVLANYLGQGWRVLMSLAFVPLYIRYLGIEAYGLIGIFAMLQAWLSLLDMGMRPALGREMARYTGGAVDAQSIWDLLRSVELVSFAVAISIAICVWAASGWLAADWVRVETLPIEMVARAFALMGAVTALQFVESIYTSSIAGLQRQVLQNLVVSLMTTVRSLGAVGVLILVSPTINAFFIWQGLVSLATVALFALVVYRVLPLPPHSARFSVPALLGIWRYAAGMMGITLLALLLTQVDKLLLSRLLSLESFGYYVLAGAVSGVLYSLTYPIQAAFYPRFAELLATENDIALRRTYHQGAQFVTVLMGSAAIVLMVFADLVLQIWTADAYLTTQVAPLVVVLALGTLLNGLVGMPYRMQLANGWTSLGVKSNAIAAIALVPAIMWVAPKYGAIGAAWIWVVLNGGYLLIGMHFMYRRILPSEKWTWYRTDIVIPLAVASATALACRWTMPEQPGRIGGLFVVLASAIAVSLAASLSAPLVREQVFHYTPRIFRNFYQKYSPSPRPHGHTPDEVSGDNKAAATTRQSGK